MKNEINLIVTFSNNLTDNQISELTREQITSFTEEDITQLTPKQISLFSAEQLSFFSIEQLSFFSKKQLLGKKYVANYWTPEVFDKEVGISSNSIGLSPEQIIALEDKILSLGTIAITNLSPEAIKVLDPKYISLFSAGQIRGLNINVLSTTQIAAISAKGVIGLTNTQLANLGKLISELSPKAINSLTTTQVKALTPVQISVLTIAQLKSLNYTQKAVLSKQQVAAFSNTQIQALFKEATQYSFIFLLLDLKFDFVKSSQEKQDKENEKIRKRLSNLAAKLTNHTQHIFSIHQDHNTKKQNGDTKEKTPLITSVDNPPITIKKIPLERLHDTNATTPNLQNPITQQGIMSKHYSNFLIEEINTITKMFVQFLILYVPFKKEQNTEDVSKKSSLVNIIFKKINLDDLLNSNLRFENLILASDLTHKSNYTSYLNQIQIISLMRSISNISNLYQTQFGHSTATLVTISRSTIFKRNAFNSDITKNLILEFVKSFEMTTLPYQFLHSNKEKNIINSPYIKKTLIPLLLEKTESTPENIMQPLLRQIVGGRSTKSELAAIYDIVSAPNITYQDYGRNPLGGLPDQGTGLPTLPTLSTISNRPTLLTLLPDLEQQIPFTPAPLNNGPIGKISLNTTDQSFNAVVSEPKTPSNLFESTFNSDNTNNSSEDIGLNIPTKNISLDTNNDEYNVITIEPDESIENIFNFDNTNDDFSTEISQNYGEPLTTETSSEENRYQIQILINNMATLNEDSINKTNSICFVPQPILTTKIPFL